MNCKKCNSSNVKAQGLMEGKLRVTCQECSHVAVVDQQGRQLLTDNRSGIGSTPASKQYLTEG